ncbi:hypothetical protein [Dactylosporangium sp. CA-233914]|uniref:hypothetical protein n=1 Tax=Dactylosporangium sp. CA-233914 TaxID=3239934 RepID=UPI003D8BF092
MGSEQGEGWQPRSRVGAVVVALLNGDEDAAGRAAEMPAQEHDAPVLEAALGLAVRSLFDEDTPGDDIAGFVEGMRQDVEVDPAVAEALIRSQLGAEGVLEAFPPQAVYDTTWSLLGYLCERRLGAEDSLQLIESAEELVLPPA